MSRLAAEDVKQLDPYMFMGVLGKRYIHPGGRRSTERLLSWADVQPGDRVLDIGCGVATTAMRIAEDTGADVTAADISARMREMAARNVQRGGLEDRVHVEAADITRLPYPDDSFDCVIAEAVTMFVPREKAASELVRVVRPGGRVLATEFCWSKPPSAEAKDVFLGQVCPGLLFDTVEDWVRIYSRAGLTDVRTDTGPFEMLTPRGFIDDEGVGGSAAFIGHALTRWSYLQRLAWLMPRMGKAIPYLGYILVGGRKPGG